MATRGRMTFQKRQKEIARKEKKESKVERREQRKRDKEAGILPDPLELDYAARNEMLYDDTDTEVEVEEAVDG